MADRRARQRPARPPKRSEARASRPPVEARASRPRNEQPAAAAAQIRALAEPLAEAAQVDLIDVVVAGGGSHRLVRVRVDRRGGVDVETCRDLSQDLSARLDVADLFSTGYRLEVTSPGVDYPLRDRRAFDRVAGRLVRVEANAASGEREEWVGTVQAAQDDAVVLHVDGRAVAVRYEAIVKATQRLPW